MSLFSFSGQSERYMDIDRNPNRYIDVLFCVDAEKPPNFLFLVSFKQFITLLYKTLAMT